MCDSSRGRNSLLHCRIFSFGMWLRRMQKPSCTASSVRFRISASLYRLSCITCCDSRAFRWVRPEFSTGKTSVDVRQSFRKSQHVVDYGIPDVAIKVSKLRLRFAIDGDAEWRDPV